MMQYEQIDLQQQHAPVKIEYQDQGELDFYKFLPLPSIEQFKQTMKNMNIKSYDDVILYSQIPKSWEHLGSLDQSELPIVNLLGIYRAQYLLEAFGHKGNIYILQSYDQKEWVQSGGQVFINPKSYMNGEEIQPENPSEYAYKLDITKIKTFDEIKKVEGMRSFHLKNFGEKPKGHFAMTRPKSQSLTGA